MINWLQLPEHLTHEDREAFLSVTQQLKKGFPFSLPEGSVVAIVCGENIASLAAFCFAKANRWIPAMLPPDWTAEYFAQFRQRYPVSAIISVATDGSMTFDDSSTAIVAGMNESLPPDAILLSTGGSTGFPKFCIHTDKTLAVPVPAAKHFFSVTQLHAHSVLPVYHISGFMPIVRALVGGGMIVFSDYRRLVSLPEPDAETFLSLVPTQLIRLLDDAASVQKLGMYRAVLLGGAKSDDALLHRAVSLRIPIAPCFGMTETAAFFAAIRPEDFSVNEIAYRVLRHADIRIIQHDEDLPHGDILRSRIAVRSKALFLGYWGEDLLEEDTFWLTQDDGYFGESGRLYVTGRADSMVISGGKKISPKEVEQLLLESGFVKTVKVLGLPHVEWGEKLVCVFVPADNESWGKLSAYLQSKLPAYKIPKQWQAVASLPYDARGKLTESSLRALFE